jgi:Na+/H+-translocating membrane pyrophosphatase
VLGSRARIAQTSGVVEPISRWSALLVTVASLPLACLAVAIAVATQSSSLLGIGVAWVGVLGLFTVIVQIAVAMLNHEAVRSSVLPRAWASRRKPR